MTRIGIIGTGGIAGAHARAYQAMEDVSVAACCDLDLKAARGFAETWGIPAVYGDYRELLRAGQVDGVSVTTPDSVHAEISIAALNNGVAVLCEKPMAATLGQAQKMLDAARSCDAIHMVNFSKRNAPALQQARALIRSGSIGRIMHVEASYLQGWLPVVSEWETEPKRLWRLSTKHGSAGTLGDLGCHVIDMASFLCGPIRETYSRLETYPKAGNVTAVGEYGLDANDGFISTVTFSNGALGTIHSTRWASGYKNREFIRVYGDAATIEVDYQVSQSSLRLYTVAAEEWKTVRCDPVETNYRKFVDAIRTGRQDECDFANGYLIQKYMAASVESDRTRAAVLL